MSSTKTVSHGKIFMNNGIDRKTFVGMESNDDKMNILFDLLKDTRNQYEEILKRLDNMANDRQDDLSERKEHCDKQKKECGERFKKIEWPLHKIIGGLLLLNIIFLIMKGFSFDSFF